MASSDITTYTASPDAISYVNNKAQKLADKAKEYFSGWYFTVIINARDDIVYLYPKGDSRGTLSVAMKTMFLGSGDVYNECDANVGQYEGDPLQLFSGFIKNYEKMGYYVRDATSSPGTMDTRIFKICLLKDSKQLDKEVDQWVGKRAQAPVAKKVIVVPAAPKVPAWSQLHVKGGERPALPGRVMSASVAPVKKVVAEASSAPNMVMSATTAPSEKVVAEASSVPKMVMPTPSAPSASAPNMDMSANSTLGEGAPSERRTIAPIAPLHQVPVVAQATPASPTMHFTVNQLEALIDAVVRSVLATR